MSAGIHYVKIDLNSSGAGSAILKVFGRVAAIRVKRNSGSPHITITDGVDTLLNDVTVASDTTYHPQVATTAADGTTATTFFTDFVLTGNTTLTIASGAASGNVEVWIKAF
jgi:hypothetical protein